MDLQTKNNKNTMSCSCNQSTTQTDIREAVKNGVRSALRSEKSQSSGLRQVVREAVHEILTEDDDDYQKFFQGVMETLNIDSPQDLTEEGREKFFSLIDDYYNEDTDEADDVPMSDLQSEMGPDHYKSKSKVPDFLKKEERVRRIARNVLQNIS